MSTEDIITLYANNIGIKQISKELQVSSKLVRETIASEVDRKQQAQVEKQKMDKETETESRRKKKIVQRNTDWEQQQERIDQDHERIRGNKNINVEDLYTHQNYEQQKKADEERDKEFEIKLKQAEKTRLEGMSTFAKLLEAILDWIVKMITGKEKSILMYYSFHLLSTSPDLDRNIRPWLSSFSTTSKQCTSSPCRIGNQRSTS
jgi:uncharacterized protein (DUF3084 family)